MAWTAKYNASDNILLTMFHVIFSKPFDESHCTKLWQNLQVCKEQGFTDLWYLMMDVSDVLQHLESVCQRGWRSLSRSQKYHPDSWKSETVGNKKKQTRVFPKWDRNSANSGNLINHWSMNWGQLKDNFYYLCLISSVLTPWSLTQGFTGSNIHLITRFFVTNFAEFSENI